MCFFIFLFVVGFGLFFLSPPLLSPQCGRNWWFCFILPVSSMRPGGVCEATVLLL